VNRILITGGAGKVAALLRTTGSPARPHVAPV